VLVFPMLAASLVLWASPDKTGRHGLFPSLPLTPVDYEESLDADSRGAKRRKRSRSKAHMLAAPRAASTSHESGDVCPSSDMVLIDRAYCIDAYEASLVQVNPDGSETPWPYYEVLPADVVVRAVSLPDVFPQGYISGLQARAACERSGKRLCAPDEWRNACMGPQRTVFPYGNQREPGRCNDNGRSSMHFLNPQLDDKPAHRWMWGAGGNMVDPRLNQMTGTLTRTGEREGCTNEYGVYDMVGNLHEWVEDPNGTFQGGYYLDTHVNGDGCNYRTTAHPMSHYDYSTGFRCCSDAASM
jgi:sulfatase modifying factor 1